jgi:hypothetical protein
MKLHGLQKLIKEELSIAMKRDKQVYLRGISTLIKNNPELPLQDIVDGTLEEKGLSSLEELSPKETMDLNIAIKRAIPPKINTQTQPSSDINPRDFGGGPSSSPFRKGYTGD